FFFFQAEDGIRYYKVTGVQTCALPIFSLFSCLFVPLQKSSLPPRIEGRLRPPALKQGETFLNNRRNRRVEIGREDPNERQNAARSEERRVGKECRSRWER